MSDQNHDERAVQLMRYRMLQREATDPLAARLMSDIVEELETELEDACSTRTTPARSK